MSQTPDQDSYDKANQPVVIVSRLTQALLQLHIYQKKALIPFFTVGDPNPNITPPHQIMQTMAQAGADLIELGIPFSDPSADGPVIQKSSERALLEGVNIPFILKEVALFRKNNQHTPIILMGYANPIYQMGIEKFSEEAVNAGVDGILIVDMPHGFSDWQITFDKYKLACIYLVTPTTSLARIHQLKQHARGYVYYVSSKGVTGGQLVTQNLEFIAQHIRQTREILHLPVMVGFGIHDSKSATAIAGISDGVIIGSAIVKGLNQHTNPENSHQALNWLYAFLVDIKAAIATTINNVTG
jgi:tryptophan synthase alpha chain